MKIIAAAIALTVLSPHTMAQNAPTPAPVPATPAPATPAPAASTARLNLDTPIETIVADPAGKAALEKTLPGVTTHEAYDNFKVMSLRAVQPLSQGALSEEMLKKIEADLALIK